MRGMADHLEAARPRLPWPRWRRIGPPPGDAERAVPLLREAATSALAMGAAEEAAAFWRQAADLAAPREPDEAARDRALAEAALETAKGLREAAGLDGGPIVAAVADDRPD